MKKRADVLLVERGLADSRAQAQALIMAGRVRGVDKPGRELDEAAPLEVELPPRFVSRGGEKLDNAVEALGVDVRGRDCLDVGASTGGFTDVLLQRGAARVIALDVGYGQLHPKLRDDPRVTVMERTNVRELTELPFTPDLVTCDVSFISARTALPPALRLAKPGCGGIVRRGQVLQRKTRRSFAAVSRGCRSDTRSMSRPLRIEFEGAIYHVTSRGTGRQLVFLDDSDRIVFLELLLLCVERFGWFVHAYVLMGNHYHLLVETPRPNLARGMRQLNGVYALRFNRRHDRWGHLFGHRYKAILIEREAHLLEVARYVVRNPVRAGLCRSPLEWRWSSCRATAGVTARPAFLTVDWLLEQFGPDRKRASRAYRRFVEQPGDSDLVEEVFAGIYLAGKPFLRSHCGGRPTDTEIPSTQRTPLRVSLAQLLRDNSDRALIRAYREHGYTLREIAGALGVHYATVSRRLAVAEATAPPARAPQTA